MAFVPNAGTLTPLWGKSVPYGYWERRAGFVNEKNGGGKAAPLELKVENWEFRRFNRHFADGNLQNTTILHFAFCILHSAFGRGTDSSLRSE